MKNCTICYSCFLMTIDTLKSSVTFFPRTNWSAYWALKTMSPPDRNQIINTILFCLKHFFKLYLICWIFHPTKIKNIYGRWLDTTYYLFYLSGNHQPILKLSRSLTTSYYTPIYLSKINTGIDNVDNAFDKIEVFPNPATDKLTIDASASLSKPTTIEITNIQGQLIKKLSATGNKTNVDVSFFAKRDIFCKSSNRKRRGGE